MKAKTLLLTIATLTFTQLSTNAFAVNANKKKIKRGPAAEAKKAPVKKKAITQKEMNDLKAKLSKLEEDLKKKEEIVQAKSLELEQVKSAQNDERISKLNKLLEEQKVQIEKLREEIKSTDVKEVTIVKQEQINVRNQFNVIICQAKAQANKLEEEIQKLLQDKESVLKQVALLKEENEKLKQKPAEVKPEEKKEEKKEEKLADNKEDKKEDKKEKKSYSNEDVVEMLSQVTNLLMSQQQAQAQMQASMFSMMYSMNNMNNMNSYPGSFWNSNPYNLSYDYAPYSSLGYYQSYPSLNNSISMWGNGIGIGYPTSQMGNGGFQVYGQSQVQPQLQNDRQPSSQSLMPQQNMNFGIKGFDFGLNGSSPMQQPEFQQMQRSMI